MPVSAIIVGAGHRAMLYASYAKLHPEALTIVGVADPDPIRRKKAAACYHIPQDMCFESAEALAARPQLADAIINGTMDTQHVSTAIPLLRAGYHMLLEKPFAVNETEMWELVRTARETGRRVMICHVLRYAPFYAQIKEKLLRGDIGEIINIQCTEHVSYHHLAVSYIRGKWGNEEKCGASMLLAKCCHDLDLMEEPYGAVAAHQKTHFKNADTRWDGPGSRRLRRWRPNRTRSARARPRPPRQAP